MPAGSARGADEFLTLLIAVAKDILNISRPVRRACLKNEMKTQS